MIYLPKNLLKILFAFIATTLFLYSACGCVPDISLEKTTNGNDADAGIGSELHLGDTVTWEYTIKNTGTETLINIILNDDKEGLISCPKTSLNKGETMICTKTSIVSSFGVYSNNGVVNAKGALSGGSTSDSDPSHYHVEAVSLGSVVWNDKNNNGIQESGEKGIAGAKLSILDLNTGIPVEVNGNLIPEITTDSTGRYFFNNLPEGSYRVKIDMNSASGYLPSFSQVGNGNNNIQNDSNIEIDNRLANIYFSSIITLDGNSEPFETNGLPNTDDFDSFDNDNGNMTLDFGFFRAGKWSGNVSRDDNNDDIGDIPIVGVTIELFTDPNGDGNLADGVSVGTTTTDRSGNYSFASLPPGDYVAIETQPAGLLDVSENEGGLDNDDNGNATNNNQISGTIDIGESDSGNDFVEESPGSWSGSVLLDSTHNGSGDFGIQNVEIKLFTDPNNDGLFNDGVLVGTSLTNASGLYSFQNLHPGNYIAVETQPLKLRNVSENEGGFDDDRPDNNVSNSISGHVDTGEEDKDNNFIEEKYLGSVSGTVSVMDYENNLHPLNSIVLVLFDSSNNEVARTTTDSTGGYIFPDVPPGEYYIQEAQPVGYADISEDEGGIDDDLKNNSINTIGVIVDIDEADISNDFIEGESEEPFFQQNISGCSSCSCPENNQCPNININGGVSAYIVGNNASILWKDSYYEINYDLYLDGVFVSSVDEDVTRYTFKNLETGIKHTVVIVANDGYGRRENQTISFKIKDNLGWLPAIYNTLLN